MNNVFADSSHLTAALLATDEVQYDKLATATVIALSKHPVESLGSKEVLQSLDAPTQTIPYLCSLTAAMQTITASGKAAPRQLPAALLPEGNLWPYITNFLLSFDPIQVRYVGEQLTKLIGVVAQGAEQTQNAVPAIQLLNHVILQLDPSSSTFTSTHFSYVRLCLLAHAYAEAVDILERPIYHIPASVDKQTDARTYRFRCSPAESSATYLTPQMGLTLKITSRGYLEYYLMGALCYLGLGLHEKALAFLQIILAAPAHQNATSLIVIDAYKRWVLLNLLVHGHAGDVPRSASQNVMRHVRAVAKPYDCVADAFKGKDRERLQAEIEQGTEVWNQDCNYGLMVEVFNAHRKFAITRLSKTYAAIPVTEVAKQTSTDPGNVNETLAYLQQLIATGSLNATITQSQTRPDQVLRFLPDSASQKSEEQIEQDLALKTQEIQVLIKHIADIEHRTEISKEYIEFLRKLKKTREDEKKDAASAAGPVPNMKAGQLGGGNAGLDEVDEEMMEDF